MQTSKKGIYQKPELNRIGSFEEITLGATSSGSLDAAYPVGTPSSELLFS